jgi:hypothetical protein
LRPSVRDPAGESYPPNIVQCTPERRTAHGIVNASRAPSITNLGKRQNRFSRCDKESFRAGILIRSRPADAASARANRRGLVVEL